MGSRQRRPQPGFTVKWQNHETNLKTQFHQLFTSQSFVDATIVCNDICIRLHKSVIAASSPYLRNVLLQLDSREHPVLIMPDTDETVLQSLVTFMYTGEADVAADRLPATLRCAENLKINGFLDAYASNPPPSGVDDTIEDAAADSDSDHEDSDEAVAEDTKPAIVFDSESLLPVELVDVSMPGGESPPRKKVALEAFKRGRGRPKKRRMSSPRSSSPNESGRVQSAEFVVKVEPPDPADPLDSVQPSPAASGSGSCNRRERSEASLRNGDEATSCSTDLDASKHSSTGLPELPPLSPSSFSCGLESESSLPTDRRRRSKNNQQVYTCEICNKVFGRKHHKVQHERTHDKSRATYQCSICKREYHRTSELVRHQKNAHFDSNSNSNSNS